MSKGRKGLSPVVSVLLLILIAVAAAVIIYSWFSGAASKNPTNTPQLYEKIKIEGVSYNSSASTKILNVTIRNLGASTVRIVELDLINVTSGTIIASNTSLDVSIPPAKIGDTTKTYINLTANGLSNGLTDGTYEVKAITSDGIEASYTFTYTK